MLLSSCPSTSFIANRLRLTRDNPCLGWCPGRRIASRSDGVGKEPDGSCVPFGEGILPRRTRRMDIEEIRRKIRSNQYVYSHHAEVERRAESLTFAQIEEALFNGRILEQYPDTGRGESCLVVGLGGETAIHVICGWRGERVALITVYIPRPPQFKDPWTRARR